MNHTLKFVALTALLVSISFVIQAKEEAPKDGPKTFIDAPNTLISSSRQITFEGPKSGEGYYSADGKKMIFQSERYPGNPFYQMYVLDLQTGKTDLISSGKGKTTCGWIHPNMKKLLYSSTHQDPQWKKKQDEEIESRKKPVKGRYSWSFDDQYEIFSSDLKGKNLKRLTKSLGYDAEGSYSPDGKWIAFASNRAGYTEKLSAEDQKMFQQDPSYMMDIYIMKEDGTQVKRLTDAKGYDGGPFFSADGKKITWRRFAPNGATAEIFTMNVDGTEQKPVTQLKSMSWAPYFHPSGDYIIFASSVLGYANFELFIVDSEGLKQPVRVTFSDGFDGLASFSPDGTQMTWSRRNEKGESQIYIASWDDAQARKLLGLSTKELSVADLKSVISAADTQKLVSYLASEKMAGRKVGGEEEKVYTQKMADLFKSFGLTGGANDGSFFEKFDFTSGVKLGTDNKMEFVGNFKKSLQIEKDYNVLSFSKTGKVNESPLVFAGYGIKAPATEKLPAYDSYKNVKVERKWVVVFKDIPQNIAPEFRHHLNTYARLQHKVTVAKNMGAVGIIFVDPTQEKEDLSKLKFEGTLSDSSLAVLRIQQSLLKELLKSAGQDLKSLMAKMDKGEDVEAIAIPMTYMTATVALDFEKAQGINVIAKLPVKGAKNGVLIGAHGDHLGRGDIGNSLAKGNERGQIHYGADDNASGVAGVMELAHYFSDQYKNKPGSLKKDIYFAIWSGEESGLLGSNAFVKAWNSTKPKNKIADYFVANLNMDMVGRLQEKLYVQGIGSGDHWSQLSEEISVRQGLPLVLQEDPYLPTDSMALYLAEIPAINFFTGSHAEYHSPRDLPESLNYQGLERVIKTVGEYTRLLSDSTVKVVKYVRVGGNPQKQLEGRSFRVYLGTIPDYTQEGVKGVRVSGASKDSPAAQAGVQEKDVIVEFDGVKIENIYDYVYTLQSVKPNVETILKVQRNGQVLDLKITPKLKD
ncbi:M28 family peptidase [Bdellovibrio sp. HCB337]|uniref:M28 family peptidase n=1 Tax=Bdellovibrio sp. HCB337 TaxID=3394358 RepID=UPI0039A4CAF4